MRKLHELAGRMVEILAIDTIRFGSDIIAAGPWVKEPGACQYRIVLRETASDWVVHTQAINENSGYAGYYWGNYFHKSGPDQDSGLASAWAKFVFRASRSLGIPLKHEESDVA